MSKLLQFPFLTSGVNLEQICASVMLRSAVLTYTWKLF